MRIISSASVTLQALAGQTCASSRPAASSVGSLRIAAIGLGTASTQLDTAVNIAFPAITQRFDLAIGDIQWVVICYVLAYASLLLALGRIGDMIEHAFVYRGSPPTPTCPRNAPPDAKGHNRKIALDPLDHLVGGS